MKTIAILAGIGLFLQGCSYAISPAVANKTDKTISFERLQADPDLYKGKLVILGGTIDQVTSVKQGTLIEVIQKPLDYWGKPRRTKKTSGHFLLLYPGYLNTMVYAPGREITVAAEVEGTGSKELEGAAYDYLLVVSKELKLWKQERQTWSSPQWIDPLYDPSGPGRHD